LNVSRIEEGSINIAQEPFDVVRMINEHLKDVAPIASSCKVKVTFKDHPGNLHILSGRNALLNILESVISNAIFYSRGGGSVVIKLDKKIDTFLITVSDTGIGIPEDEQSNIFSKFTRASNAKLVKTDGTGLGLYIAREAVRLLGGKIWFESQQGRGTTFYIELPVHSEPISGEKPLS